MNENSEKNWKRKKNGHMKIKWIKSREKDENGITAFKHGTNSAESADLRPPTQKLVATPLLGL